MTFPTPKVSVVIPSYNHSAYVGQTVQSILDQSFQDFEIVITDDASTDDSVAILRSFGDSRISLNAWTRNLGISAASNAGIARASGEYVALLASDDWALPDRLERQVEFLDQNPTTSAVFGLPLLVDERGTPLQDSAISTRPLVLRDFSRQTWLSEFFFHCNCLWPSTVMIRREAFKSFGTFNVRLTNLQDFDLWVRMMFAGHDIHVLPDRLAAYRIRDCARNMSAGRIDSTLRHHFEFAMILRRYWTLKSPFFREVFADAIAERGIPPRRSPLMQLVDLSLTVPDPAHRWFALETLHCHAQDFEDWDRLRELSGAIDVFGSWTIQQRDTQIAGLERVVSEQAAVIGKIKDALVGQ